MNKMYVQDFMHKRKSALRFYKYYIYDINMSINMISCSISLKCTNSLLDYYH